MKIVAKVKLDVNQYEKQVLINTLEQVNVACNLVSEWAWNNKVFRKFEIHKEIYYWLRKNTNLSAQSTIRAIGKVADSYKTQFELKKKKKLAKDREWKQVFVKPRSAVPYDERLLSWNLDNQTISIWSLDGRLKNIPFKSNEYNLNLLHFQQGQTDLIYKNGKFYLNAVCDIPDVPEDYFDDLIGIDMGVNNIIATSDGDLKSADYVESRRLEYENKRAELKEVGTRSAKRKLRKISGKQSRFQRDVNHCLSKWIVELAKGTNRGIILEDLTDIRERVTVRREQRAKHSNWSFGQLSDFIVYKAKRLGIYVGFINPAYTSQQCPACGYIHERNRKNQAEFECIDCGYAGHADIVGAINIRNKGFSTNLMVASF